MTLVVFPPLFGASILLRRHKYYAPAIPGDHSDFAPIKLRIFSTNAALIVRGPRSLRLV